MVNGLTGRLLVLTALLVCRQHLHGGGTFSHKSGIPRKGLGRELEGDFTTVAVYDTLAFNVEPPFFFSGSWAILPDGFFTSLLPFRPRNCPVRSDARRPASGFAPIPHHP